MAVLNQIAFFQNRRDELPNQVLAKALVAKQDMVGIREIAANLWHENPNVRSDCLKVLYEIGEQNPALIADYAGDFLRLLNGKNNRLVWGSMTALAAIAPLKADELYKHHADIERVTTEGSVITTDYGIKALAVIAASSAARNKRIFPFLLTHLATCRPKDVPQRAEKIAVAVTARNRDDFLQVLEIRMSDLSAAQAARLRKVIKAV
jgi:hypothetical protein